MSLRSWLGHIFLGAHHTLNCMNQIDNFDEDDKLVILNGILGHHGKYEYGSPILLKTVEAQILHLADVTSGDIESIISFSKKGTGGRFSVTCLRFLRWDKQPVPLPLQRFFYLCLY